MRWPGLGITWPNVHCRRDLLLEMTLGRRVPTYDGMAARANEAIWVTAATYRNLFSGIIKMNY